MNAGASPAGQAFALRNCDAFFTSLSGAGIMNAEGYAAVAEVDLIELTAENVARIKAEAQVHGRDIGLHAGASDLPSDSEGS
jgi:hypothetical protein